MPIEWLIIGWLYLTGFWLAFGISRHAAPDADARHLWIGAALWPVLLPAVQAWKLINRQKAK